MKRRIGESIRNAVKYKIHAINSVNGVGRSANNNVFYDTFQEAETKVHEYLAKGDCQGFVIMRTIAIYKQQQAPITTYVVKEAGGSLAIEVDYEI